MSTPAVQGQAVVFLAVLCERILVEKDETTSIIRIADKITLLIPAGAPPPYAAETMAVVGLRPGGSKRAYRVTLVSRVPNGDSKKLGDEEVVIPEGELASFQLLARMTIHVHHEGMYYFDVLIDDELAITMPLRIVFQREQGSVETTMLAPGQQGEG